MPPTEDLAVQVRAAAAGDGGAVRAVLEAVQDPVYRLALRMLGHPADAEDAAQEILVIVVTHLGSFRGESAFMTWVWRIAANHLARVRRGRREVLAFDLLGERLRTGLADEPIDPDDPEAELLTRELRLRCTEAMILCLDRELRIAYLLGDIFELSGQDAAAVLDIEPATYRKRLSRARRQLHGFVRSWCGVFDPSYDGRVAIAGFLGGGGPIAFDPLTQLPSGVQLSFFASAFAFGSDVPLARIPFQQFADDAARGVLRARPAHVFEFADIVAAHRLIESGEARGKIVVRGPED